MELFKIKKSKVDRGTYYKAWRKMFPDEFPEEIPTFNEPRLNPIKP